MENLDNHKKEFERIIQENNLNTEEKASQIANYVTGKQTISAEEFSAEFGIPLEDSKTFLSFIKKGISFKEEHVDKKDQ